MGPALSQSVRSIGQTSASLGSREPVIASAVIYEGHLSRITYPQNELPAHEQRSSTYTACLQYLRNERVDNELSLLSMSCVKGKRDNPDRQMRGRTRHLDKFPYLIFTLFLLRPLAPPQSVRGRCPCRSNIPGHCVAQRRGTNCDEQGHYNLTL